MHFDLKRPCADCPFVKGSSTQMSLDEGRIEGIVKDIQSDMTFQCHKTLDMYTKRPVPAQHCAGALMYHEKYDTTDRNFMLRLATRLGLYDRTQLDSKYLRKIIDEVN